MAKIVNIGFFNLILIRRNFIAFLHTQHQIVLSSLSKFSYCFQLFIAQAKSALALFLTLFKWTLHSVLHRGWGRFLLHKELHKLTLF